jgi:glycosyltransferase 2 family protein
VNGKHVALLAAKLLLSVGLLGLVLARVDPASILEVLWKADPWLVALWYSLAPVNMALAAWRWEILAPGLSYGTALKYTWIGVFFGHVLPGSIAGDIAKGVSLALKDSSARSGLAASIVAEKVIGLAALVLFFDLACAVVYLRYGDDYAQIRHLAVVASVLSLVGVLASVVAALYATRGDGVTKEGETGLVVRAMRGLWAASRFYGNRPALLLKAFGISTAIHVLNMVAMFLSFRALRVDAGLLLAAIVYPVLSVMLLIPISISGIGVRDATLAVLFGLFGLPAASGVALSWLALFSTVPNVAIGGAIQLWEMHKKR